VVQTFKEKLQNTADVGGEAVSKSPSDFPIVLTCWSIGQF